MRKRLYICISVMLCIASLVSCVKDPTVGCLTSATQDSFFTIDEAQTFFESNFSDETRSSEESNEDLFDAGCYTPQWSRANISQTDKIGSVDVPIIAEKQYRAIRKEVKNGKTKSYVVVITQKLVVVKSKLNNSKSLYLLTLIPDKSYYSKNKGTISRKFLHAGDKNSYSGYALYSCDGVPICLDRYMDGERVGCISILGSCGELTSSQRCHMIYMKLREMKIQYRTLTYTRTGAEYSDNTWRCMFCGGYVLNCNCLEIVICGTCGNKLVDCTCSGDNLGSNYICPNCGNYIYECDCILSCEYCNISGCLGECQTCPHSCGTPWCYGECQGGGGSESSGSSGDDSSSSNEGNKLTANDITSAATSVIDDLIDRYGYSMAVCNYSVRDMFNKFYDTGELNNMQANAMCQYWSNNPDRWEPTTIDMVQYLANDGRFVVSGWINPSGASGHVAVVVPGSEIFSGTWGMDVPMILDAGAGMRESSIALSYGYGADKKGYVKFYYYK